MSDGGAKQEYYMSEMITHAIADDAEADEVSEAKELFELTVVSVSNKCLLQSKVFRSLLYLLVFRAYSNTNFHDLLLNG